MSLNLYTYCHNEPIMYTDPTGHKWVSREVAPHHYETIWAEDLTWEQYKKMSSKDQIAYFECYYFDKDTEKNLGPGRTTQKGAWEEALENSTLYRTWKGETLLPGATALGLSAADSFGVQPAILVGYLGNWLFRGKDAADYEWPGWQNGWNIIQEKVESYTVKSKDDVDFYNSFRPKVDLANGIYGLITGARSGWKGVKGLRDMRLPVAETFVDAGTGEKIRVSNSGNAQTPPSILKIEQSKYVNSSKSNPKLYRKMSIEEAKTTIEQGKLQPAKSGKDPSKWTTTSIEKVTQPESMGGFNNYGVPKGTTEVVVEFELSPEYFEYIQKTAIPQRGSKKLPNIKYHYEGLTKNGPDINYGITPQELEMFNSPDNLLNVKIVEGTTNVKK